MPSDGDDEPRPDDERESTDAGRSASPVTSLSVDTTLELLSDYDRRRVLGRLMDDDDGTATVDELVEHLVAARTERVDGEPNRDRIATRMYHVHLPKLAECNVVEYDTRSREVRYWGEDRLEAWHDRIRRRERF